MVLQSKNSTQLEISRASGFEVFSLVDRPEFVDKLEFPNNWPEYISHDLIDSEFYKKIPYTFPEFTLAAVDRHDKVVARACSVPLSTKISGRDSLPTTGWDQVMLWAFSDHHAGIVPNIECAIGITVHRDYQGNGLSAIMLSAMLRNARDRGHSEMVAPVRPTLKHLEPRTSMIDYAHRTRADGLPADPWLRTHIRAGGTIDSIAPASMVISGSLDQWRQWTGLPFDTPGSIEIPSGLVPALCVPSDNYAIYVEPNVWIRHNLPRHPTH